MTNYRDENKERETYLLGEKVVMIKHDHDFVIMFTMISLHNDRLLWLKTQLQYILMMKISVSAQILYISMIRIFVSLGQFSIYLRKMIMISLMLFGILCNKRNETRRCFRI